MRRPRAVFFDFGGTLYDLNDSLLVIWESALEDFGIRFYREAFFDALHVQRVQLDKYTVTRISEGLDPGVGVTYWRDYNRGILSRIGVRGEELLTAISNRISQQTRKIDRFYQIKPDAAATLRHLKSKYVIGLISNTTSDLRSYLQEDHVLTLFDVVGLSHEMGMWKPDKGIFHSCCKQLSILPSEAVHVGDSPISDIEGAQKSGMQAIQVCHRRCIDSLAVPEATIRELTELIELLMPRELGDVP